MVSLYKALGAAGFEAGKLWGTLIEDRGSQITFSALGQQAPIEEKKKWDPDFARRKKITGILTRLIPEFSVRMGGATSIDVTKQGIDKAYGIRKLRDVLGIGTDEMIFAGDALFPGGNDYPAEEAGVVSIRVRDPNETKRVIEAIIACLGSVRDGMAESRIGVARLNVPDRLPIGALADRLEQTVSPVRREEKQE